MTITPINFDGIKEELYDLVTELYELEMFDSSAGSLSKVKDIIKRNLDVKQLTIWRDYLVNEKKINRRYKIKKIKEIL